MAAITAGTFEGKSVPTPAPEPQPTPTPTPTPTPAPGTSEKSCDWRTGLLNVNGGFRGDAAYNADIDEMVKLRNKARVRWLFVPEQDTATNAGDLCDALGRNWKYTREQGRDSRLSSAIHFDASKDRLLDSGRFDISTSSHDNLTWGLWQDLETGVLRIGACTILWPFPIGPNVTANDDKIREDAMRSGLRQLRAYGRDIAKRHDLKHVPLLFGGDLNHPRNDKPDVVGNAMTSYRLKDSDVAAAKRINGWASTHAKPGGLDNTGGKGRIDRFGIDYDDMTCEEQTTLDGYAVGGAHNMVVVSTTATNRKAA
jgi:hypothetical protein